ncbi:ubiquitin-protein ligase peroxin 10 [Aspergillus lucknowensis]|uniref:RING-type E3 ubiquitin transferase n=1 Tax=Aspergillus lucknowensis TaxID=176173 RepID=A0ABR4L9P1_9EURO
MADEDLSLPTPTPPTGPSTHFYPFATSPDIIRSHEKDAFLTAKLANQSQSIIRTLRGARFAHAHSDAIQHLTELLYFSLTTLIGNRTLGEEYCDLVQLEDDTLRLPSITRRVGYILSSILVPWTLRRILPLFRQRLRAKLERSIARQQLKAPQTKETIRSSPNNKPKKQAFVTKLRIQKYILEHLDSITSLSPIYALSIATFYFTGSYYHLSKRFWGLRYVFTKKLEENEQRVGYEVLGVLLVLQITVQSILHVQRVSGSLQQEDQDEHFDSTRAGGQEVTLARSIEHPSSLPLLPTSNPRYDLSEDPRAIPWIPTGQQQKCTLCLESFKDPSVTTCGHVFCWTCVCDWIREKPECPLCRQEVLASKVLPLRG